MDVLTALSLAAADWFCADDWGRGCDAFDWPRPEAAATIALNESPHCAIAAPLNAAISTDNAASLTPVMTWIVFIIPIVCLFISFPFFE